MVYETQVTIEKIRNGFVISDDTDYKDIYFETFDKIVDHIKKKHKW